MLKLLAVVFTLPLDLSAIKITNYKQNDYIGKTERMEIVSVNTKYMEVLQSQTFKFNRTCAAYNLTMNFLNDYGSDLVFNAQVYKFASNEYRYFPIMFPINVCRLLEQDIFGSHELFRCGNFTMCPFKKGIYAICNFVFDYSKFPPHIPFGRYLIELKLVNGNASLMTLNIYVSVKDPKWEQSQ